MQQKKANIFQNKANVFSKQSFLECDTGENRVEYQPLVHLGDSNYRLEVHDGKKDQIICAQQGLIDSIQIGEYNINRNALKFIKLAVEDPQSKV